MGLRFTVLASGSTGNATLVEAEDTKVLIDAGLSAKKIEELLQARQAAGEQLSAIFVTHEHTDHIRGLGPLSRKFDVPIYTNEKTWNELDRQIGEITEENKCTMETGSMVEVEKLKVESFGISHDAAEPVGYSFYFGDQKLSVATDLGYVSQKVKEQISDADVLILESNHDIEMLRMGKYPWNIKRRILGDTGHLSNEAAGEALNDLLSGRTKRVYLAHLSRDHNMIDLARMTVQSVLDEEVTPTSKDVQLMDTYWDRSTPWDDLDN